MNGLDFSKIIDERTQDFTGRGWVLDQVDDWLASAVEPADGSPAPLRTFLLTGGPGTGKTAMAARIAQVHLGEIQAPSLKALRTGSLAYFHFCQAGLDSTLSPRTFVESLAAALASRYPAYLEALKSSGSQQYVINSIVQVQNIASGGSATGVSIGTVRIEILSGDAGPLFDLMVRNPLQALCQAQPDALIVILVDSLDEALSFNLKAHIPDLLSRARDLPPQVRFIATCRSSNPALFDLVGPPTLDLIADAPVGPDEVLPYAMARLKNVTEPGRSQAAQRVATGSKGNFLYAFHVLNRLLRPGTDFSNSAAFELPDTLEGIYREFLKRQLARSDSRWIDVCRPILGLIAVARGEGLRKRQLIDITELAEDTANDTLNALGEFLVGGDGDSPYRIYHQSFRDFLLTDTDFNVYPAERHASIARYLQDEYGTSWGTCDDVYALRYTALHWADAATLSEVKREARTSSMIELTQNEKYQRRFERKLGDISTLKDYLHRSVQVASLNERTGMLPWLIRAPQGLFAFHRKYLYSDALVKLAAEGSLTEAEARLRLFTDIDEDWRIAARLILAWLANDRDPTAASQLHARVAATMPANPTLQRLINHVSQALQGPADFPFTPLPPDTLYKGEQLVKRISGQSFDQELLHQVNPSMLVTAGQVPGMTTHPDDQYAAANDAPILVGLARQFGDDGTAFVDRYIDAHAGYNYVEYRNRSLWYVLTAVLNFHPSQPWVKDRVRRVLMAGLTGGAVDFRELLPFTAELLRDESSGPGSPPALDRLRTLAINTAEALRHTRGADDSWGLHKRRLAGLMELSALLAKDRPGAEVLLQKINELPQGFAGFQAPAWLRLADALLASEVGPPGARHHALEEAVRSAHHILDYHFCARITARCNALRRWHQLDLSGDQVAETINRLAATPAAAEFAADHFVGEAYRYRDPNSSDVLSVKAAQEANSAQQLAEVFQRPMVDFRLLNPTLDAAETFAVGTRINVPDPGFAPLLAVHLSARAMSDPSLEDRRAELIRSLVPVASVNPTALDTVLSYLLIAVHPDDADLVADIVKEAGPVAFGEVAFPLAQIGPDSVMPT